MLSASIITYLGVFTHEQRMVNIIRPTGTCSELKFFSFQECIESWLNLIIKCQIPCTPSFSLVDCLIDHVKMRAWNIAGLPNDKYSLDNGIITTHTTRWPLLIDPQGRPTKFRYTDSDFKFVKELGFKTLIHYLHNLF
jgi:dynein heavy chain